MSRGRLKAFTILILFLACPWPFVTAQPQRPPLPDPLKRYFQVQVDQIERSSRHRLRSLSSERETLRRELLDMLGLWPMPERTDLNVRVTGREEHDQFIVEKIAFESYPGLVVTANLYLPNGYSSPRPAVLYVCGHAGHEEGGRQFGSKIHYAHHPEWFARQGLVAFILDTLQLGEIPGLHHGLSRENRWWWLNRGYTPAGIETWNAIRALDYLETRQEVDASRIAMTGRSGGGITTWWTAAVDERVSVAVPVAGVTDLRNYVIDGVVEGHCDCMFMINRYRWDFDILAAMVAPRPLLVENSDQDPIFPLDGVMRVYQSLRSVYQSQGALDRLGLVITPGPHRDTQDIQVPAFRWIMRWLTGDEVVVDRPAKRTLSPARLKVFDAVPQDALNGRIDEIFRRGAPIPPVPANQAELLSLRDDWQRRLAETTFSGWPGKPAPPQPSLSAPREEGGMIASRLDFWSQEEVPLSAVLVRRAGPERPLERVHVKVIGSDDGATSFEDLTDRLLQGSDDFLREHDATVLFYPRGVGPGGWSTQSPHVERRFALLGQTVDGMRVWDILRLLETLRSVPAFSDSVFSLAAGGQMAGVAAFAALMSDRPVARLVLREPQSSLDRSGPYLIEASRILDLPQVLASLLPETEVELVTHEETAWDWTVRTARALGFEDRLKVE